MEVVEIIQTAVILLLGGGSGILYAKYQRKKEEAAARKEGSDADVQEAQAYRTRISNLADELTTVTNSLNDTKKSLADVTSQLEELQKKFKEVEEERNTFSSLAKTQAQTIAELREHTELLEKQNISLARKNRRLKAKLENEGD